MAHTLESAQLLSTPMWGNGFEHRLPAVLSQLNNTPLLTGQPIDAVDHPMYRETEPVGGNIEDAPKPPALDPVSIKWMVLFGLGAAAALLL